MMRFPDPPNTIFIGRFTMYGDGNYEIRRTNIYNVDIDNLLGPPPSHIYEHNNPFPSLVLPLERKTDDVPPGITTHLFPTEPLVAPSTGNVFVGIAVSGVPPNPYGNDLVNLNGPPNTSGPPLGLLHVDYSHDKSDFPFFNDFYMENDKFVTFPISYRPEGEGVLLFYFNNGSDHIAYVDPTTDPLPFGTYFPHYKANSEETVAGIAPSLRIKDSGTNVRDDIPEN